MTPSLLANEVCRKDATEVCSDDAAEMNEREREAGELDAAVQRALRRSIQSHEDPVAQRLSSYEAAVNILTEAIELAPTVQRLTNRASLHKKLGRHRESLADANTALALGSLSKKCVELRAEAEAGLRVEAELAAEAEQAKADATASAKAREANWAIGYLTRKEAKTKSKGGRREAEAVVREVAQMALSDAADGSRVEVYKAAELTKLALCAKAPMISSGSAPLDEREPDSDDLSDCEAVIKI